MSKRYLFYFGHPAHYHLFKNIILELQKNGHKTQVVIKSKDILENLCKNAGIEYINVLPEYRKNSIFSFGISFLKKYWRISKVIRTFKPDILLGSEPTLAHLGLFFNIPSFVFSEDDVHIIPQFAKITYPFVNCIISPQVCDAGKWNKKKIGYDGFHKLAYLHPSVFIPNRDLIKNIDRSNYFILRLAELSAYHDNNRNGINRSILKKIIEILEPHGTVYINAERPLEPEFEKYRLSVDPQLIHHVLYFSKLYIGDSQSMAVESALLGTPGIRFNDFVGEISVLNELENKYKLTVGVKTSEKEKLFSTVHDLLSNPNTRELYRQRRVVMIQDKINVLSFFLWFIENYPESKKIMKENPDYQYRFK